MINFEFEVYLLYKVLNYRKKSYQKRIFHIKHKFLHKMKLTFILSFILLTLPFSTSYSQDRGLIHKDDASRLCDDVLFQLEQSETLNAMKLLREKTKQKESVLTELITFLETSAAKYGRLQGSDLAKSQEIGEDIFRFTYALRHEKHPVWLQFYFYKIKDAFELKKIDWGEDMEMLF